jgi:cell division protease FtsH
MAFGKSKAKFQMDLPPASRPLNAALTRPQDFCWRLWILKRPERFTAVGARIPKRRLLVGPPGTGKTLPQGDYGEAGVPSRSLDLSSSRCL